jgi:hypothetical protein
MSIQKRIMTQYIKGGLVDIQTLREELGTRYHWLKSVIL